MIAAGALALSGLPAVAGNRPRTRHRRVEWPHTTRYRRRRHLALSGPPRHHAASPTLTAPGHPGRTLSVLVVDDHPDAGQSLALLLARHGHAVRLARSCAEAAGQAAAERPDVVVLEVALPDGDGYVLAELLRALPGPAPAFVAVTWRPGLAPWSRAAGFLRHLEKPADLQALLAVLRRIAHDPPGEGRGE